MSLNLNNWLFFTGLLFSLWIPTASAFEIDEQGNCPPGAEPDVNRLPVADFFTITGEPDIYTQEDADTLINQDVSKAIGMHTRLFMLKGQQKSEFRTAFVTTRPVIGDRKVCGWFRTSVDSADVLPMTANKITVGNVVEWTDPVTDVTKTLDNPLPLKALLKSNPETESGGDVTTVSIYDKPSRTSRSRTEAKVFGVYYIYAERYFGDNEQWFWIAGDEPRIPTKFSGWVPIDHVIQWGSQLSLFFNESTSNTGIYADRRMAAKGDVKGLISSRPERYKERSEGPQKKQDIRNNIARFPIIEEFPSNRRGESLYQIGFFGDDQSVEDSSDRAKISAQVRNVDILFLLDNTESMTEYFSYVVEAIRNSTGLIERANRDSGSDVKVKYAAAIYGDYLSESANLGDIEFEVVSELGPDGYTEHLRKLTDRADTGGVYRDPVFRDRPEAGLAGVKKAIEELDWSDNTAFKVVVWIGDHGSRDVNDREPVSIDDVTSTMKSNKVLLFPINVSGRYDNYWNNRFIEQGNRLTVDGMETRVTHNNSQSNDYDQTRLDIEQSILNMYLSTVTASVAITEGTNINQTIKDRPDLFQLDIPAARADVVKISTAICEQTFGSQGCANLKDRGQFMAEGYVKYDERDQNFSFWVNLNQQQLEILHVVLDKTCEGFDRGTVKRQIERAMIQVQQAFSLDDTYSSNIAIGEYLRRFLFLPAGHFPTFLESTPDKIDELWQDARQSDQGGFEYTAAIADPICRSAKSLDLVLDGKRLENMHTDLRPAREIGSDQSYGWAVADNSKVHDFDWEWAQGGENNYYYIPVEFLPGDISSASNSNSNSNSTK